MWLFLRWCGQSTSSPSFADMMMADGGISDYAGMANRAVVWLDVDCRWGLQARSQPQNN